MIRANFGVNPRKLDEEEWAELVSQAVWIETERLKNLGRMIAGMFGSGDES